MYFEKEIKALDILASEGVILREGALIQLTAPLGRLLVRTVASVMDSYLPDDAWRKGLSMLSKVG